MVVAAVVTVGFVCCEFGAIWPAELFAVLVPHAASVIEMATTPRLLTRAGFITATV
jgi:hypothetical protein